MVVIDGPRFSTRAESQWYAAQGGTLINMTGAPEAALARELRMCYAALALVTDMDAGAEGESGVGQEEVFALFRSNLERLTGLLATAIDGAAGPRGLHLLDLGRRHRAHLRRARGGGPVRVLLTGSAGFIGTAVGEVLEEDGHEVVRVDLMLPMAHGAAEPPAGTHHLDVRDAGAWVDLLRGVDAVCHQAAVVGAGVRVGDLPEYAGHNDLGTAALLAAMHEAGVDRLVLASSMVVYGEGRYRCPEHGAQTPPPREVDALAAGDFDNHCPRCALPLDWALVEEDARLDPRSSYAASKVAQEHYTSAWVRQAGARAVALRYHNVYGPGMPRDTPYSGVAALFRSSLERGEPPQVFEDGGQARDFVHVADVARANLAALRAVTDDATPAYAAYNVASGHPVRILDVATLVARGTGRTIAPVVTGGYRLGDVRHVVASPARAAAELGFSPRCIPSRGCRPSPRRRSATDHQAV